MTAINISTSTATEDIFGDDAEVTRITFTFTDADIETRADVITPRMGGSSVPFGANRIAPASLAGATEVAYFITPEELTASNAPAGHIQSGDHPSEGIQRVSAAPEETDSVLFADNADNDDTFRNNERWHVYTCTNTDLGGWFWPAADYILVWGRFWYLVTKQAPRSVYANIIHTTYGDHGFFPVGSSPEMVPPVYPKVFGNPWFTDDTHESSWPSLVASDDHFCFMDGKVYYPPTTQSQSGDGVRSAVWGLPPTCRVYFSQSTFSVGSPGSKDAESFITFYSSIDDTLSQESIIETKSVTPTEDSPNFWRWKYHNTSLSLAAVSVPDWADIAVYAVRPGDDDFVPGEIWAPLSPLVNSLALTCRKTGDLIPGIMREIT